MIQTAIIQSPQGANPSSQLPLAISSAVEVPALSSDFHVRVRVLTVALNPNDHKMMVHHPMPGNMTGCDFCGVVEVAGESSIHTPGTRVCGAVFPYKPDEPRSGAFAETVVADSRLLIRVPSTWTDLQGGALGGVGWSTACLAISHPEALGLEGLPSKPAETSTPILVYGGATATGTMACQLLKLLVLRGTS